MSILKIKDWKYRFNPKIQNSWNVMGWKNNPNFFGTPEDWHQTIVTKINEISAHIHMATLLGGADSIETHSSNMIFIESAEYYNKSTKKLGKRFDVVINDTLDINSILVYKAQNIQNLSKNIQEKLIGMVVIKNRI